MIFLLGLKINLLIKGMCKIIQSRVLNLQVFFLSLLLLILHSCNLSNKNALNKNLSNILCDCLKKIPDSNDYQFIDQEIQECFDKIKPDENITSASSFEKILQATYQNCPKFLALADKKELLQLKIDTSGLDLDTTKCEILHEGRFKYIHSEPFNDYYIIRGDQAIYEFEKQEIYYKLQWLSSCKYKSTVVKNHSKPRIPPYEGESFIIEIIDIKADTITLRTQIKGINSTYYLKKIN